MKHKTFASRNIIYKFDDNELLRFPRIRLLVRALGTGLTFVFSEQNYDVNDNLHTKKPLPPPLDVINLDKETCFPVRRKTHVFRSVLRHLHHVRETSPYSHTNLGSGVWLIQLVGSVHVRCPVRKLII